VVLQVHHPQAVQAAQTAVADGSETSPQTVAVVIAAAEMEEGEMVAVATNSKK
jgi:hypothetical protein